MSGPCRKRQEITEGSLKPITKAAALPSLTKSGRISDRAFGRRRGHAGADKKKGEEQI